MKSVSVVFTQHAESGLTNVSELLVILERIKPEVIFLECPHADLDRYVTDTHARLEATAVSRYREIHPVDLVPVDLPTPEPEFFAKLQDLIGRIALTGPEYDRVASWHRQYVAARGFPYLNSAHCSDLLSEHHEVILSAIVLLADHQLAEFYDTWIQTNKRRDTAMMTNIENYCQRAAFSTAAFLVGAAHRQSIIDLSASERGTASSTIRWDFASFLDVY